MLQVPAPTRASGGVPWFVFPSVHVDSVPCRVGFQVAQIEWSGMRGLPCAIISRS